LALRPTHLEKVEINIEHSIKGDGNGFTEMRKKKKAACLVLGTGYVGKKE